MSGTVKTCFLKIFQCNRKIKNVFHAKMLANYNNAMFEQYLF